MGGAGSGMYRLLGTCGLHSMFDIVTPNGIRFRKIVPVPNGPARTASRGVRMRYVSLLSVLLVCSAAAFAQTATGTITGTISDPAGAVVPNAPLELKNSATGTVYQTVSSSTGNYTLSQLPAATYELTVNVPGFKTHVRQNLGVQAAQTIRIDVVLEVGTSTESVTVSALRRC